MEVTLEHNTGLADVAVKLEQEEKPCGLHQWESSTFPRTSSGSPRLTIKPEKGGRLCKDESREREFGFAETRVKVEQEEEPCSLHQSEAETSPSSSSGFPDIIMKEEEEEGPSYHQTAGNPSGFPHAVIKLEGEKRPRTQEDSVESPVGEQSVAIAQHPVTGLERFRLLLAFQYCLVLSTALLNSIQELTLELVCEEEAWAARRMVWHRRLCLLKRQRMRNRRRLFHLALQRMPVRRAFIATAMECTKIHRSCWVKPGRGSWWTHTVPQWDDGQWLQNFRMTKATLMEICSSLHPYLHRNRTVMRLPVPEDERVAIAVMWLTSKMSYREIGKVFHRGRSTVARIVVEVCLAIEHVLLKKTVFLGDYKQIMAGFQEMGFPHCVGVVDGCHVEVLCPKNQSEAYWNTKYFYSVILQGTVDHRGRFINVQIGWPGNAHDAFVFHTSSLRKMMDKGTFVPGNPQITVGDVTVPPLILADQAYPMRKWLMKPYSSPQNSQEEKFNEIFNRCHSVVERAFGRLKARWRRLSDRLPVAQENFISVIASCVVLHNICEAKGHTVEEDPELPEDPIKGAAQAENDLSGVAMRAEGERVREAITRII